MRIVEREHIDIDRWDQLVDGTEGASVFSFSWYLDATAENWCALLNEDYTLGLALPYTVRAGQEILYTPIFVRYLEKLGTDSLSAKDMALVTERFRIIQITLKEPLFGSDHDEYVYQRISKRDKRNVGSQAKRSLTRAIRNELTVRQAKELVPVISVIQDELEGRYHEINRQNIERLTRLFEGAQQRDRLHAFEVVSGDVFHGGIICIRSASTMLYVKGAANASAKKNGAMYLALDSAIEYALNNGLEFDFGGSRIKGVRDFNHNLGGRDVVYFAYTVNNGPAWFKLAKRIRNKWIKK